MIRQIPAVFSFPPALVAALALTLGSCTDAPPSCDLALVDQQADTIVLGCTHYPFIKPLIQELTGPDVTIIDSGEAVARQLRRRLQETGLLNDMEKAGYEKFWCSNRSTSCASSVALLTGVSDIRELPL